MDGERAAGARLGEESRAVIPVIVLGEFRCGIAGSRHRAVYEAWLEEHLADFDVLPIVEETTERYAQLRVDLKKAGRPIPANDAWIAALALQHRLPVLNRDERFDGVPGVRRASW